MSLLTQNHLNQLIQQVGSETRAAAAGRPTETPLAMQIVEAKRQVRATLVRAMPVEVSPKAMLRHNLMLRHNQSHLVAPIILGQGFKVAVKLRAAAVVANAQNRRGALRISIRLEMKEAAMCLGRAAVTTTSLAGDDLAMTTMMISRTSLMMKTTLGLA